MSEIKKLQNDELAFLEPYLPQHPYSTSGSETTPLDTQNPRPCWLTPPKADDLPYVTLTYASSLDSMIAIAPGARTTLSGPETKYMTHYLRKRHDAILVGAGTAATDDPGLNCRYPNATIHDQPRPVIIDPNGRFDPNGKKIYQLASKNEAREPWIIVRSAVRDAQDFERRTVTAELMIADENTDDHNGAPISWTAIFKKLKENGCHSVMVEGGATIINALLAEPDLVDAVIMTIAPTFLGAGGVAVAPAAKTDAEGQRTNAARLYRTSWRQFGDDAVLCGRLRR